VAIHFLAYHAYNHSIGVSGSLKSTSEDTDAGMHTFLRLLCGVPPQVACRREVGVRESTVLGFVGVQPFESVNAVIRQSVATILLATLGTVIVGGLVSAHTRRPVR
jgi:hypothetical protein